MNVAHEQEKSQHNLVPFPKKEQETMAKEEGYTPLPNFLIDERYFAVLSDKASVCLVILNRHIKGHHLSANSFSANFFKELTGIQDDRTVRKVTRELAKFGLIRIDHIVGKSLIYTLTFDQRIAVNITKKTAQPLASNVPRPLTKDVPRPHASNVDTSNVTPSMKCTKTTDNSCRETPDMECPTVKEIPLNKKENVVVDNNAEKFKPQNKPILNFIEYYPSDPKSYSLKDLCQLHSVESDFKAQAKVSFADLSDEIIQNQFSELCQWSLTASKLTSQKWMSTWIKFLKSPKPASTAPVTTTKPKPYNSRNVNDAWGAPKQYAPCNPNSNTEGGQ